MFLTITIDTVQKKTPVAQWRKPLNIKRRSFQQRVKSWVREVRGMKGYYKPAMF